MELHPKKDDIETPHSNQRHVKLAVNIQHRQIGYLLEIKLLSVSGTTPTVNTSHTLI